MDKDRLGYTIGEVLTRAPFGRTKLYQLISSGALRARHCGRRVVILHDDLVACLDALPVVDTKDAAEATVEDAAHKRQRRRSAA